MSQRSVAELLAENALLREEVRVARRASDITAEHVVRQFVEIEKMLQRLEESESRFRDLYQRSSEREQLYESLLNSTPDAVIIYTADGKVSYINHAFTRIFGFTMEDVRERRFPHVPESERDVVLERVKRVLKGEPISGWETKRITKEGVLLDVMVSASCYRDHEGKPAGAMAILRDVTERKQAEQLIRKEREIFFTMLDKAPYGAALLDKDGRALHFNMELINITGYTTLDASTMDDWFRVAYPDPEYRKQVTEAWKKGAAQGGKERVFKVTCKDGQVKQIEFRRAVLEDGRHIVTLSDVTERKRAEEQIHRAKEEWERTFNAIDDVVTIQDSQMRIMRVNRAAMRMFGVDQKELIGKYCFSLFFGKDEHCEGCPALKTLMDHSHHSSEIEFPHLGRIFLVTTSPIFDENSNFTAIVHTAKDITEKRKMEEELLRAQKLESVGILAGGIAHDFNNILTVILGNISLGKMYLKQPEKILAKLDDAEKASLMAQDLTQQLLTFARGGAPIMQTTSISDFIRESVSFAIRGSGVKCEFFVKDNLWAVEIDKGQMNQVINNLIINAVQAMPEGGIIRVSSENVSTEGGGILPERSGEYVRISIRDQGGGILEEHLQKIFDPYFTTKSSGSGLGLATAYSIVRRHNGYITVESEHKVGTAFHVYLPASYKEVMKTDPVEQRCLSGKGKILLMDDEEIVRDIAGEMLVCLGYTIELARDGAEAIEMYKKAMDSAYPFHAVIMDLTIPGGMGGEEAVQKLLELDSETKAIVSSGYSNDPVMSRFKEYGFKGVVAKPYRIDDLNETLINVIDHIPK